MAENDNRLKGSFEKLVRQSLPHIDYLALYRASVVAQPATDRLDIRPFDTRLPGMQNIEFRTPPGLSIFFTHEALTFGKANVLLGWSGGNPNKPYCICDANNDTSMAQAVGQHTLTTGTFLVLLNGQSAIPAGPQILLGSSIAPFPVLIALPGGAVTASTVVSTSK